MTGDLIRDGRGLSGYDLLSLLYEDGVMVNELLCGGKSVREASWDGHVGGCRRRV